MAEVAEIARNQESTQFQTLDQKEQLDQRDGSEPNDLQRREIEQLSKDQRKLSGDLTDTANRGLEIMEEASRNPLVETSTLQEIGKTVQAMSETSTETMTASKKTDFRQLQHPIGNKPPFSCLIPQSSNNRPWMNCGKSSPNFPIRLINSRR